jgi:hypothetical protein
MRAMRRVTRRLFSFCCGLSLVLCLGACVLWARSYGWSDKVVWTRDDGQRSVRSASGRVVVHLSLADLTGRPDVKRGLTYTRDTASVADGVIELILPMFLCYDPTATWVQWQRAGFAWSMRRSSDDLVATAVAPFWSVAAATAALPLGWSAGLLCGGLRTRRRKVLGRCPACGYDLRASPARCPECGVARGG